MLNRSKLWATGLLVAVFVTGAAVGGGMSQAWGGNGQIPESEMAELWQEVRPKFDALRDTIRIKIMDVLTEEQQQKYRDLLAHGSRRGERERDNRNQK